MENARTYSNEELAILCPGLTLITDFVSEEEEQEIALEIDAKQWDDRLSRRVQHYGFEFDYATRMAIENGLTNSFAFPNKCGSLLEKLPPRIAQVGLNQLTVNEYLPGRGIATHVDSHSCFGDVMLSVSLLANTCIRFTPKSSVLREKFPLADRVNLWVPRRALLIMEGPSRFAFAHCIASRKSDLVDGVIVPRVGRRISLTFRSIKTPEGCSCEFPDACEVQKLIMKPPRLASRAAGVGA